jgi:hypothetical protein
MRQFQTNVLDFKFAYEAPFASEPYECGWAAEAIFFLRIEEKSGQDAALTAYAQISADGLHWVDAGPNIGPLTEPGDYFLRLTHFGGFIRLRGEISGHQPRFQMTNNLVLKE